MKIPRISRREALKAAGGVLAGTRILHPRAGGCAAAGAGHARPDRGGHQGRPGHSLHLDRSAGRRETGQGVRGEISGDCRARRTHRRRARVPAYRSGIFQQHPRRRRGEFVRCGAFHRLEARRRPRSVRAGGRRQILPAGAPRRRWPVRKLAGLAQHHRLQHQSGEGRGRAEEFRRSARSQMEGQDRQGASRL